MSDIKDKDLFKQAIIEALAQKYDEELAQSTESADYSLRHANKMRKILGVKLPDTEAIRAKRIKKRAFVAAIIAAVVLLTSCTGIIFGKQIYNFFEKVYDKFIEVSYNDDTPTDESYITEIYKINYVPEGYELESSILLSSYVVYLWENNSEKMLKFEQYPILNASFLLDAEEGATNVIQHKDFTIYYREFENSYIYIWNDEHYAMQLFSNENLGEEQFLKILDSITTE